MNRITVFCGSSLGNDVAFQEKAFLLGKTLANRNIELVYGGANVGLMGAVADGVLTSGGKAIGVLFARQRNCTYQPQRTYYHSIHARAQGEDERTFGWSNCHARRIRNPGGIV